MRGCFFPPVLPFYPFLKPAQEGRINIQLINSNPFFSCLTPPLPPSLTLRNPRPINSGALIPFLLTFPKIADDVHSLNPENIPTAHRCFPRVTKGWLGKQAGFRHLGFRSMSCIPPFSPASTVLVIFVFELVYALNSD